MAPGTHGCCGCFLYCVVLAVLTVPKGYSRYSRLLKRDAWDSRVHTGTHRMGRLAGVPEDVLARNSSMGTADSALQ